MANVIEEFIIAIGYKVEDKELSEAEKKAKEAAKKVADEWRSAASSIGSSLKTVGASLAGLAAGAVALTVKVAQNGAEIDSWSRRLGTSAKELQRLQFAGSSVGAEVGNVRDAIKDFEKNLGDFQRMGSGPAADSLKTLGISLAELVGKSTEEKMALFADRLSAIPSAAVRSSVTLGVMGDAGGALLPLFEKGGAGIRALGDEAERMGVVLDDSAISASKNFQRELGTTKAILGGLATDIGVAAMPAIRDLVGSFRSWIAENRELLKQRIGEFSARVTATIRDLVPLAKSLLGAVSSIASAVANLTQVVGPSGMVGAFAAAKVSIATMGTSLAGLGPIIGAVALAFSAASAAANAFLESQDEALNSGDIAAGGRRTKRGGASFVPDMDVASIKHRKGLVAQRAQLVALLPAARAGVGGMGGVSDVIADIQAIDAQIANVEKTGAARFKSIVGANTGVDAFAASASARAEEKKPKRGGGAKGPSDEIVFDDMFDDQAAELFSDEIERLGARSGANELARQKALSAAAESLRGGSTASVARQAAVGQLSSLTGFEFKESEDTLSKILGVTGQPDIRLADMTKGMQPQVLNSVINNQFTITNDFDIDGSGDPVGVANAIADQFMDLFTNKLKKTSEFAKVEFLR